MIAWIKGLFSSDSPTSSMRLVLLLCVLSAIVLAFAGLGYILYNRLDASYILQLTGLVAAFLSSVVAKVIQSFAENKKPESKPDAPEMKQ